MKTITDSDIVCGNCFQNSSSMKYLKWDFCWILFPKPKLGDVPYFFVEFCLWNKLGNLPIRVNLISGTSPSVSFDKQVQTKILGSWSKFSQPAYFYTRKINMHGFWNQYWVTLNLNFSNWTWSTDTCKSWFLPKYEFKTFLLIISMTREMVSSF